MNTKWNNLLCFGGEFPPALSVEHTRQYCIHLTRKKRVRSIFNRKHLSLELIFFQEVVAEIMTRVPILIGHQNISPCATDTQLNWVTPLLIFSADRRHCSKVSMTREHFYRDLS